MKDITEKVKAAYYCEGRYEKNGRTGTYRRIDIVLPTLDGGEKKFAAFLKDDQRRLCGLSDPDFVSDQNA